MLKIIYILGGGPGNGIKSAALSNRIGMYNISSFLVSFSKFHYFFIIGGLSNHYIHIYLNKSLSFKLYGQFDLNLKK